MFKNKTLIYQLKANLDEQSLLGKIIHHLDPEIMKMLVKNGKFGNENSKFHAGPWFTCYRH